MKRKSKFAIGGTIIFFLLAILIYQGLKRSMMPYLEVQQLEQSSHLKNSDVVQVAGIVKPGSIYHNASGQQLTFTLQDLKDPAYEVQVEYQGVIPDNFKPGLQVVVQGNLKNPRDFQANRILTKCPSKYNRSF